jgi:hypothetical protein
LESITPPQSESRNSPDASVAWAGVMSVPIRELRQVASRVITLSLEKSFT